MTEQEFAPGHSIAEVVQMEWENGPEALVAHLVSREEGIAEVFRLASVQYGLYVQIVNEVMAGVGFGAPKSEMERAYIRAQYVALMEELQRMQGGQT